MINTTIKDLQQHKRNVLTDIANLVKAVASLDATIALVSTVTGGGAGSGMPSPFTKTAKAPKGKRTMSASAKAAIGAAQKARWAKYHAGTPAVEKPAKKKSGMSAAGRARIAAAQKKRWAKYNKAMAGK